LYRKRIGEKGIQEVESPGEEERERLGEKGGGKGGCDDGDPELDGSRHAGGGDLLRKGDSVGGGANPGGFSSRDTGVLAS